MSAPATIAPSDVRLACALDYAARGWPVFPLHSVRDGRCSCGRADCPSPGKHPQTAHGLKDASRDPNTLRAWWVRWSDANIGILTGNPSGLLVVDVDPRSGGDDTLADLEARHGPLPETVEALTGGGGRHVFFKHPGFHVKARTNALGDGLDIKGDGGYVVASPSVHISGRPYAWEVAHHPDDVPLAAAPAWLLDGLAEKPAPDAPGPDGAGDMIPEGQRNASLARLAGAMRRQGAPLAEIEAALMAANANRCEPPLDEGEVCRIAASVGRYPPAPAAGPATKAPNDQTADAPVNTPALADAILESEAFAVDAGGKLWRYRGGVYHRDGVRHVARMTKAILARHGHADRWTTYRTKEVAAYLAADAPELWGRPPLDRVNLANGILDVKTRRLYPHTPEFLSPVQLPVAFDPVAACPAWERFCGEVFPPDCADYLPWELAAWLMLPITDIQKAVLLLGGGANGKSTFLAALTRFLGRENVAARTLHALEANRFATAGLVGKLANVAADLPARHLTDTSTFKVLTGTEFAIPAEYKHGAQFDFPCFARLVFSANHPPTAGDASEAFFRRWLVVPFERIFEGSAARSRAQLDAELADPRELSGVLNRALAALPGVLARGITESASMRAAWGELRHATDPISVFLDARTLAAPDALVPKAELLAAYNADARQNGRALASATAFGLAVKRAWPDLAEAQRTVGGRLQWCWVGLGIKATENRK